MAFPMRPNFFFDTSAPLEFPTLAKLFPGFTMPADFVEVGAYVSQPF